MYFVTTILSFVTTTYDHKGDGPLIFTCYQHLRLWLKQCNWVLIPIVLPYHVKEQIATRFFSTNCLKQRNLASNLASNSIYLEKVNIQFYDIIRAFRSARLCCPVQVQGLQPTIESLELLRKFPFLDNDTIINGLAEELPKYLALSDGVQVQREDDKVKWWARNVKTLPKWAAVVRKILLVQPSSGAAERVFSLLNSNFSKGQEAALEETVKASIMLKYNYTQREKAK